mmetsp:Transcript_4922/g.15457  ORF Transcript_4922/g.15457 Transcript_4922/m.15457 type:complete len:220 (+) Transcript_4922:1111-1770(+)
MRAVGETAGDGSGGKRRLRRPSRRRKVVRCAHGRQMRRRQRLLRRRDLRTHTPRHSRRRPRQRGRLRQRPPETAFPLRLRPVRRRLHRLRRCPDLRRRLLRQRHHLPRRTPQPALRRRRRLRLRRLPRRRQLHLLLPLQTPPPQSHRPPQPRQFLRLPPLLQPQNRPLHRPHGSQPPLPLSPPRVLVSLPCRGGKEEAAPSSLSSSRIEEGTSSVPVRT